MPVVSSQYWNSVHGRVQGEAREDAEGLQTMRVLGRNMARLLKAGVGPALAPEPEERLWTHFIRYDTASGRFLIPVGEEGPAFCRGAVSIIKHPVLRLSQTGCAFVDFSESPWRREGDSNP